MEQSDNRFPDDAADDDPSGDHGSVDHTGHPHHLAGTAVGDSRRARRAVRLLTVGLVVAGAVAALGLIALWPRGGSAVDADWFAPGVELNYVDATIVDLHVEEDTHCEEGGLSVRFCTRYVVRVTSGGHRDEPAVFSFNPTEVAVPDLAVGDQVVLVERPELPPDARYYFHDYQRSWPLAWLVLAFAVAVLLFGGWQGLRALAGLGVSLLVLVLFVVPSLLRDSPALPVALVASALVAVLAIYLAHGFNLGSSIALAGTLVSLAITALLALLMATLAQITGLVSDEARFLQAASESLDLRGLLIAGIVIGALGVIDDVTVSQVSTVSALRRADPGMPGSRLYATALRVGRDHVAAAVNTLVLAYVGASLPLLLVFSQGVTPVSRLLTGEIVAVEIVRMLVGSIGLILSVPVTTGLAALIFTGDNGDTGDTEADDTEADGAEAVGPGARDVSGPERTGAQATAGS